MKKITFEVPINSVSFGQLSISLLREFYNKSYDVNLFEIGQSDLSAQQTDDKFNEWLQKSINSGRLGGHTKENIVFKLWHILPSIQSVVSKFNSLYTFHETDRLTDYEKSGLKCQDLVFVSSNYTRQVFNDSGINNVIVVPPGFDSFNFSKKNKKFYPDDRIVWGLIGKCEKRKNTVKTVQLWAKRFGNNPKHVLHLLVNNQFINQNFNDPNATQKMILQALEGKQYNNIVWYNSFPSNSDVNDFQNCLDIDLSGISLNEGWGLPYFNSLCLGKHGIALNAHANKMFANNENSVLIQPNEMVPAEDNLFFVKGNIQNQGYWFGVDDDDIISAMEVVSQKAKTPNLAGEKLKEEFSMHNMGFSIFNNLPLEKH